MKTFSELLKNILNKKKISYSMLEKETGISSSSISHYANGLREPDIEKIKILAKALAVPAGYFFEEVDINEEQNPYVPVEAVVHWGGCSSGSNKSAELHIYSYF
ncbi:MAG: helix-turn-helix domain-containing protein [Geovibrio sp.]|nr:helix-turn-helix domain-containing protein [Geovibrio sp.]